jgi:glycine oxidase
VESYDAVVVGGGIIGLACAWRASQRGLRVCVLERDVPGSGATQAAAGVLAPDPETPGFTALARRSAELWPAFAAELEEATGIDVGYTRCGSLALAFEDATPELAGEWLDAPTLRALEPGVSPACTGAVLLEDDAEVDPRRVVGALAAALGDAVMPRSDVVERGTGAAVLADGTRVHGASLVLAAGAWSAVGLAPGLPIRPVKGETVRLRGPLPATRIIRGPDVYVVPRASGETVVGATVEDAGFDTTATEAASETLLAAACRVVPAVGRLHVVEQSVGLRPCAPDGAPLIGVWGEDGLLIAGGHYRNGILLAPVTAEAIAALLVGEEPPPEVLAFAPVRLAG